MSSKLPSPCMGECPDRNAFCHGTCEKYAAYRAVLDATKAEKYRETLIEDTLFTGRRRVAKAYGKLKGYQGKQYRREER